MVMRQSKYCIHVNNALTYTRGIRTLRRADFFFGGVRTLGPLRSSLCFASSEVSPCEAPGSLVSILVSRTLPSS